MPKISFTLPAALSAQDIVERLHHFLPAIKDRYKDQIKDLNENWDGNKLDFSFKTMGFVFKGIIEAANQKVIVNLDIPFAAMMVKGKIEQEIKGGLERLLKP
ncbi:MAG TPA: polyhydroxyalkanoic acid system family protein [Pirellulales bacterium]|nr:polyhydroxyalkanoic acid system family protein [Pirellulales bacterium]